MPYIEYACEGRLLFRTETTEAAQVVPRIHEVVLIDDKPHQVVDVEYWARRLGANDRRMIWPTVHVVPISEEDWQHRLERRTVENLSPKSPKRY